MPIHNTTERTRTQEAALAYARAGIPIFPLSDKQPVERAGHPNIDGAIIPEGMGGFHQSTIDEAKIERWMAAYPACNWGTPTGHHIDATTGQPNRYPFDVLDIDVTHGGLESIRALMDAHEPLPDTARQITGTNGFHYCFVASAGLRNSAGDIAPGIDVRATGGYIVIAPSIHPITGKPYEWEVPLLSPEGVSQTAPWPEWLLQRIKEASRRRQHAEAGARIPLGMQEATLMRIAGSMRRQGSTESEILVALRVVSQERCDPAVAEPDLARMAHSAASYDSADPLLEPETDDMADGRRFAYVNGDRAAYCPEQEADYAYRLGCWERRKGAWGLFAQHTAIATKAAAMAMPGKLPSELSNDATDDEKAAAKPKGAAVAHAIKLHNRYKLSVMQELARPLLSIEVSQFDADPWLFNAANGTLDLRSGQLREHRHSDYLTHQSPIHIDLEADAPIWRAFIERITGGDAELADYLQRIAGLILTGITTEQYLFLIYGDGQNGKSTYVETLAKLLGDYWLKLPTSALMVKRGESIPNDIARLPGRRMVVANEVAAGKRLDEATVKDLTGDDTITARFMRQEFFDFQPTHKLFLYGNYRPVIRGTDLGIWRRVKLIPFTQTISEAERDLDLKAKLATELPGILNWAIEGCMRWQRDGLHEPQAVKDATKEYRDEMDVIGQFLEECTELHKSKKAKSADLYAAYQHWAEKNGEYAGSSKLFGGELTKRGLVNFKSTGNKYWKGVSLNATGKRYQTNEPDPFSYSEAS